MIGSGDWRPAGAGRRPARDGGRPGGGRSVPAAPIARRIERRGDNCSRKPVPSSRFPGTARQLSKVKRVLERVRRGRWNFPHSKAVCSDGMSCFGNRQRTATADAGVALLLLFALAAGGAPSAAAGG